VRPVADAAPPAERAPAAERPAPRAPEGGAASGAEPTPTVEDRRTFDEVNRVRAEWGLPPFRWNDRLFRAAYDHSREQRDHGYMGHGSPDPARDDLADRLRFANCGRLSTWAEVVAWNYDGPLSVVYGWMHSAGHRKILTDPTLTDAAFSRVGQYFTGNFATPARR
jgi:uncharacterized protein YkwD